MPERPCRAPALETTGLTLDSRSSLISVFMLVSDLAPGDSAAQARILATQLPGDRFRVTLGSLAGLTESDDEAMRASGIAAESLPVRSLFDWSGIRKLGQQIAQFRPAILQTWGVSAARLVSLVLPLQGSRIQRPCWLATAALPGQGLISWIRDWPIRQADRIIVSSRHEGDCYHRAGVLNERLTLISPAIQQPHDATPAEELVKKLGLPADSRVLVASGRSERGIGPKDAIVAFDMLRYESPQAHLLVFGTGTETSSLQEFGRALAFDDYRIHFSDQARDRAAAVSLSEAVFNTHVSGGTREALEAMAAGKPVVGWQTPELSEIVVDGVTGFLVPLGDRATLAARMRKLLDEPELQRQMGDAGRRRVEVHFSVGRMIEQYARLYAELVS